MNSEISDSDVSKEVLVEQLTEQQNAIEELQEQQKIHESQLSAINNRLDSAEKQIEEQNTLIDQMKEIILQNKSVNISPAEQLLSGQEWEDLSVNHSENRERAIEVVEKWSQISISVSAGDRVKVSNLSDYFEWAETYQTTIRVCNFVEKLTNNKIILKENASNEKILVLPSESQIHTSIEDALFE